MYIYEYSMIAILFILFCILAYFVKDMIKQGLGLNPLPEEEPKSYSQQLMSINWAREQNKLIHNADGTSEWGWAIRIYDGPFVGLYYFTLDIPMAVAVDMIIMGQAIPKMEF